MDKGSKKKKKQEIVNSDISNERVKAVVKQTLFEKCAYDGVGEIAVALSGGPDSVCLLFLLRQITNKITAIHLNHCLRGDESYRDEDFCKAICSRLGIDLVVERSDIAGKAADEGKSLEEAGRLARYDLFERVCVDRGIKYIAVGHNKEDNAETIFMNILRGTGLEGLKGIAYERLLEHAKGGGVHVIRPMLDLSRRDIEKICQNNQLNPITDSSNLTEDYRRNKIRLNIFPYIEEQLKVNIVDKLCEMSSLLTIDEMYMEKISEITYNKVLLKDKHGISLNTEKLNSLNVALASRIIRKAYNNTAHTMVDFGMGHVEAVLALSKCTESGKQVDLPHNVRAVLQYGKLIFKEKNAEQNAPARQKEAISIFAKDILSHTNGYTIDVMSVKMSLRVESLSEVDDEKRFRPRRDKPYDMCFDFNKLFEDDQGNIMVRSRAIGDVISPITGGGKKKLKDYLIDLKIPREERDGIPLLVKGSDVIWAVGVTPDKRFLVTPQTKIVCFVHIELT